MTAITRWISSKFLSSKSLAPDDYVRPETPTNCPNCNGKIEQKPDGEEFVCRGMTKEEARENLRKYMPDSKFIAEEDTPPCGWHGRADEYGKTWM